mgnify:CR=1 FL=1
MCRSRDARDRTGDEQTDDSPSFLNEESSTELLTDGGDEDDET